MIGAPLAAAYRRCPSGAPTAYDAEVFGLPDVLRGLPAVDVESEPTAPGASLASLQARLGYAFANPSLLRAALTLGSWANEHADAGWPSNACLEFFGDAVLDLLAADVLWHRHPTLDEGELTRLRAIIVSEPSLATVATSIDLGRHLWLGRGDDKLGGRRHKPTLADALEAVLGAVFLDARERGLDALATTAGVFTRCFDAVLVEARPDRELDPKSRLQQWAQARHRVAPSYVRIDARGGDGPPRWRARVELRLSDGTTRVLAEGEGESLREAERLAAEAALAIVGTSSDALD
jgi:ribonuclease-3